ncbi:MFS transporter [Psychromicrobium lacuslunae]|uniref:MFS transporter n=1 Tax=Psychromicrobium lacuslunae TaxID=1618207 RepID=UPI0005D372A6|nr:MFS transporter [Psychromicrobium lacuslunae]
MTSSLSLASSAKPPVRRLWFAVLAGYLALGATLQQLPLYLSQRFAADEFTIGLAVGLAFAGTAVIRPFAGWLGDIGRGKAMVVAGALATSLAAWILLYAGNIPTVMFARVLMGLGEGALFSAALGWLLKDVELAQPGRTIGGFGLSMWAGLSLGPLLATALNAIGGDGWVWAAVLILPLIALLLVISAPATRPSSSTKPAFRFLSFRALKSGSLLGMGAFGYGTISALLIIALHLQGQGAESYGLAVFSAAFLLIRLLGSSLVDYFASRVMLPGTLVLEGLGLVLFGLSGQLWLALLALILAGAGLGLVYPATSKLTISQAGQEGRGMAIGSMTSLWDVGIMLGGPIAGAIATAQSVSTAFVVAGAVGLLAALLAVPLSRPLPVTVAK